MKTWLLVLALWLGVSGFTVAQASTICVGQVVYANNGNDLIGQVAAIFGNQAEVRWLSVNGDAYTGQNNFWSLTDLSPEVQCARGLCENTAVYGNNGNDLSGVISRIFDNGKAEVRWNQLNGALYTGNPTVWDIANLSSLSGCVNNICVGQSVFGNNGNDLIGVVSQVYANGKVLVSWSSVNGEAYTGAATYWDATTLSVEVPSYNGVDRGDVVYGNNGNQLIGTVLRVFANGKAQVNWQSINGTAYTGAPTVWDVVNLQKSSYCSNGPCH